MDRVSCHLLGSGISKHLNQNGSNQMSMVNQRFERLTVETLKLKKSVGGVGGCNKIAY